MKRILITGGAGFIGSNFVRLLLKERTEYTIFNLDKLTYAGNLSTIADFDAHPQYKFIHGDIADADLVESIFANGIDAVVNFAAESHVDRSISDPGVFIRSNIQGVHTLLEAARRHKTQRFLQISTDEVYGELGEEGYFTEQTHIAPSSPYSSSKASGDLLVQAWHHTYGMHTNITRCSNNYGPYQFPEKLIPVIISKAINNEPLPIYGDGSNIRDWIHVFDHNRAALAVLERGTSGRVYNIGSSSEKSNLTLVKVLLDIMGKSHDRITFVKDRPGHDWRYAIDSSRIQDELNWEPTFSFEEGISQTVEWYLDNKKWWTDLLEQK
jgi:dTDP-glucose 4,6-dehydratase